MKLHFDIASAKTIEFGVDTGSDGAAAYSFVPTNQGTQEALREMAAATWQRMIEVSDGVHAYEPSEKHGSLEYFTLALSDELGRVFRNLHSVDNLEVSTDALDHPDSIACYFVRLTDKAGHRLTGIRKASQFRGVLKKRLLHLVDDALTILEDRVFKLDNEFDVLVDHDTIHVLRPSAFESLGQLQAAVLAAAAANIEAIQKDIGFVDFAGIASHAGTHPRAARLVASIRHQKSSRGVDKAALKQHCKRTGIDLREHGGKLLVASADAIAFLEVLDRRRYEIKLVKDKSESYRAPSRKRL